MSIAEVNLTKGTVPIVLLKYKLPHNLQRNCEEILLKDAILLNYHLFPLSVSVNNDVYALLELSDLVALCVENLHLARVHQDIIDTNSE